MPMRLDLVRPGGLESSRKLMASSDTVCNRNVRQGRPLFVSEIDTIRRRCGQSLARRSGTGGSASLLDIRLPLSKKEVSCHRPGRLHTFPAAGRHLQLNWLDCQLRVAGVDRMENREHEAHASS